MCWAIVIGSGVKMKHKILLISGKQGSGKDTLANQLIHHFQHHGNVNAQTFKFAEVIYKIHDFALNYMEALGFKITEEKDGPLLQYLGTEWGRKRFGHDVWVRTAMRRIDSWQKEQEKILEVDETLAIITDCRFTNELEGFPDAYKIRLECAEEIRKERRGFTWRDNVNHPSEVDLDWCVEAGKFDLVIDTGVVTVSGMLTRAQELLSRGY